MRTATVSAFHQTYSTTGIFILSFHVKLITITFNMTMGLIFGTETEKVSFDQSDAIALSRLTCHQSWLVAVGTS